MKLLAKIFIVVVILAADFYLGQEYISEPDSRLDKPEAEQQSQENKQQKQEQAAVNLTLDFGESEIKVYDNIDIKDGNTVFELLEKVSLENDLELKYKDYGSGMGVFIESIDGVANDFSANRFWQYWVNSEYAKVGASNYELKDGDRVEWKYVGEIIN